MFPKTAKYTLYVKPVQIMDKHDEKWPQSAAKKRTFIVVKNNGCEKQNVSVEMNCKLLLLLFFWFDFFFSHSHLVFVLDLGYLTPYQFRWKH